VLLHNEAWMSGTDGRGSCWCGLGRDPEIPHFRVAGKGRRCRAARWGHDLNPTELMSGCIYTGGALKAFRSNVPPERRNLCARPQLQPLHRNLLERPCATATEKANYEKQNNGDYWRRNLAGNVAPASKRRAFHRAPRIVRFISDSGSSGGIASELFRVT
jgi:hypothetical protein